MSLKIAITKFVATVFWTDTTNDYSGSEYAVQQSHYTFQRHCICILRNSRLLLACRVFSFLMLPSLILLFKNL